MTVARRVIIAWQQALAAEHRAFFGYGVLGPYCSGEAFVLAQACAGSHQQLRLHTTEEISAAGATPVSIRADYPDLYSAHDQHTAARLAVALEDDCAAAWRYLYATAARGASARSVRTGAQQALTDSAVRGVRWRRVAGLTPVSVAFPGI